jgi:hypothetical protein
MDDVDEIDLDKAGPSGLKVKCIITGKPGYLSSAILQEKLKEFGSPEEVAKHYICRGAGKYLRQGLSQQETRVELGLSIDGFIPVDDLVIERALGETKRRRKSGEVNPNDPDANGVYWWQKEDFKVRSDWNRTPINVAESTRDACLRPDIYLDDVCENCPYFSECTLKTKKIKGKVPKIEKIEV